MGCLTGIMRRGAPLLIFVASALLAAPQPPIPTPTSEPLFSFWDRLIGGIVVAMALVVYVAEWIHKGRR